jgi:hypothetical protein
MTDCFTWEVIWKQFTFVTPERETKLPPPFRALHNGPLAHMSWHAHESNKQLAPGSTLLQT